MKTVLFYKLKKTLFKFSNIGQVSTSLLFDKKTVQYSHLCILADIFIQLSYFVFFWSLIKPQSLISEIVKDSAFVLYW